MNRYKFEAKEEPAQVKKEEEIKHIGVENGSNDPPSASDYAGSTSALPGPSDPRINGRRSECNHCKQ